MRPFLKDFRQQYSELSWAERSGLRTVALGLGFILGLALGALFGDTWTGAAYGSLTVFGFFVLVVWGA
jgi:hypothetical protein